MNDSEGFPGEHVHSCFEDTALQRNQRADFASLPERAAMVSQRDAAIRKGAGSRTEWIWFESPKVTWEMLCGRAGWLLYDPDSRKQLDFRLVCLN